MPWLVENASLPRPPALPEKQRRIGHVTVEWIPAKPGEAAIVCEGGTIDDRWLAEVITREELAACGIRQARFTFDHTAYNMGGDWFGHDEVGPSPNRGLSGEDKFSWTPGQYGKGILSEDGVLHGWGTGNNNDGDPIHDQYQNVHGLPDASGTRFWLDQEGNHYFYTVPGYVNHEPEEFGNHIREHLPNSQYMGIGYPPQEYDDDELWESEPSSSGSDHEAKHDITSSNGNSLLISQASDTDFGHVYYDYSHGGESGEDRWSWTPGQYGKGVLTQDGVLHGWRTGQDVDGNPWHTHYEQTHGISSDGSPNGHTRFRITPDGNITGYSLPAYRNHPSQELMHYVNQHLPNARYKPDPIQGWSDADWQSPVSKVSHWDDIMAKAKRLIQSGNVTLLRNGYNNIVAHVIGDHGEYQCEISRDDPNSRAITQWTCECPWDQYAFQRTRQWKKYEARPCAHVLAAYWKSQGTPLDEDAPPGASPAGGVPGQTTPFPPQGQAPLSPFSPQMPQQGPEMGLQPGPDGGAMPGLPPAAQMTGPPQLGPPSALPPVGNPPMQPDALNPAFMAPAQTGLIPPFPLEPAPQPVSVPGARPGPYPANPVQQPGTFSHVHLAAPPKIVDQGGFFQGLHDAAFPIGYGFPTKPVAYDHNDNTIYIGGEGEYHGSLRLPHALPVEQTGRLTKDGYLHWYYDHPSKHLVADALGAKHLEEQQPFDDLDWEDQTELANQPDPQWQPYQARVAAEFVPDSRARLNEATLGQSEGREGATDAGQWMEIPEGANVEIVYQDPSTGWVEIRYPLKGGPMTSYHVTCFVEPEKLAPLPGDSPMAPRRRR